VFFLRIGFNADLGAMAIGGDNLLAKALAHNTMLAARRPTSPQRLTATSDWHV
jgi:hypothetical protein